MKFVDFSPSISPSDEEQRDALQKGLGRAVQWAKAKRLADDPLLNACLIDQRYDMQVEDSRSDWLWQMVEILDAKDRFRAPILHAIHELANERSSRQLCELAFRYAQVRDEAFRTRLYEIVESRVFEDDPSLGELELLRLDGCSALAFVARLRGDELSNRDWDWHDGSFIDEAIDLLGEYEVRNRLDQADDQGVCRFRDRWDQETRQRKNGTLPTRKELIRSLSVNDILSEASQSNPPLGTFRGWGMHASEADLKAVLAKLWESTQPTEIECLLRVFSTRALPSFDSRLIELCQHAESDVRRWAFLSLEKTSDPAIREFALQRLQVGDRNAISLLTNNFEPGDEQVVLDYIDLPSDPFEVHSILLDVIKMLENNEVADASQLGVIVYAKTPCETCRLYAARHLHQLNVVPDWLVAECQFDSVEDCRRLGED